MLALILFTTMTSTILASGAFIGKGARHLRTTPFSTYSYNVMRNSCLLNNVPKNSRRKYHIVQSKVNFRALTMKRKEIFDTGDEVETEVDGMMLNGSVLERRGGWYTVRVNLNGKEALDVKRRASSMKRLQEETSTLTITSTELNETKYTSALADQLQTNQDILPMTPDSMTITDIDAAISNQAHEADDITNKKDLLNLEQCMHFSKFKKWVVFTDLHCSSSSLSVCLSILSIVHETAKSRNAGK